MSPPENIRACGVYVGALKTRGPLGRPPRLYTIWSTTAHWDGIDTTASPSKLVSFTILHTSAELRLSPPKQKLAGIANDETQIRLCHMHVPA